MTELSPELQPDPPTPAILPDSAQPAATPMWHHVVAVAIALVIIGMIWTFSHGHEARAALPFAYFHDPASGAIVCPHCGREKHFTVTYSAGDQHFPVPHLDYLCDCSKRDQDGWSTGPWMSVPTEAQWNAYVQGLQKPKSKPVHR